MLCKESLLFSLVYLSLFYRSAFMYGMVLISCRPLLVGAELFVDYRLNPENEMPKW